MIDPMLSWQCLLIPILSSSHLCYRNFQCFYGNASHRDLSYVCHTMYIVI